MSGVDLLEILIRHRPSPGLGQVAESPTREETGVRLPLGDSFRPGLWADMEGLRIFVSSDSGGQHRRCVATLQGVDFDERALIVSDEAPGIVAGDVLWFDDWRPGHAAGPESGHLTDSPGAED